MMLADLQETKDFLRYDDDDNDPIILGAIEAASAHILAYLKVPSDFFDESDLDESDFVVPDQVRMATMIYAGIMLRDPSGVESEKYQHGYLPLVVMNLLHQLRDPAYAFGSVPNGEDGNGRSEKGLCCWWRW